MQDDLPVSLAAAILALALLSPLPARAETGSIQVGVEALTDFPIQVGGKVWVDLPYRVRLSTSLG